MRKTWLVSAALLVVAPLVYAQDSPGGNPTLPAEILGPPLVAWSALQQPRPIPAPLPSADNQSERSPSQAGQPQAGQQRESQSQQAPAQSFIGTIASDHGKYVLKVGENTGYQIDDQEKAQRYEGKQVRVAGSLDAETNVLRVTIITSLS